MAWQLQDAVQFCKDNDADSESARDLRVYKRLANNAVSRMLGPEKYPFQRRQMKLVWDAIKTTGTVSINVDATGVTGVGTNFAAGDAAKYIRFNGEPVIYETLSSAGALALTLNEAYRGDANLAGATFELLDLKQALPSNFRCLEEDVLYTTDAWPLTRCEPDQMDQLLQWERANGQPYLYCIRSEGTNPAPFLWIYPAPSTKTIITGNYYVHAAEAVSDTAEFGIPQTQAAIAAHQQWILALLKQFQKVPFAEEVQLAERMTKDALRFEQRSGQIGQRSRWGEMPLTYYQRHMPGTVDPNP